MKPLSCRKSMEEISVMSQGLVDIVKSI